MPLRLPRGAQLEGGLDLLGPRVPPRCARSPGAVRYILTGRTRLPLVELHDQDRIEIRCDAPMPLQLDGEDVGDVTEVRSRRSATPSRCYISPVRTSAARTTTNLTATEAALLGVLALNGPLSGYDVRKAVDNGVGYFWGPAKTQIYTVLPRLVDAGFATREQVEQADRPDKHVYEVTSAGRDAVTAWLEAAPPAAGGDRSPFLLRVFLGALASPDALVRHVRAQREEAESLRGDLEQRDAQSDGSPRDFHAALTRRYGLAYATAVIEWATAVEQELGA